MKSKKIYVLRFVVAIALLCLIIPTVAGCSVNPTNWVKNTIQKYYYRFDGDYSSLSNLDGLSIGQMVEKLDRYSAYYTEQEYAAVTADNAGSKSGIGISYTFLAGTGVQIRSVVGNSPAKKAGLKAGDIVTSGSVGERVTQFNSTADFSAFVNARITGENFTLYLENGKEITLAKAEYTASYASMYTNDSSYEIYYDGASASTCRIAQTQNGIPELPEGAAYIYLSQFYGFAADEIGKLIHIFNQNHCTSLILDLRDNGGGYVNLMSQIGGRFTTSVVDGSAVSMRARYKDGSEAVEHCVSYYTDVVPKGTDVYVMANHNTASASEALIGVLVSYNILNYENIFLSKYEGYEAKSYGKGIMQRTFEHFTGAALKLTVAGIYWPMNDINGNPVTIHEKGLTVADGCVAAPASDDVVSIGYDDELVPVIEKIIADRQQ